MDGRTVKEAGREREFEEMVRNVAEKEMMLGRVNEGLGWNFSLSLSL